MFALQDAMSEAVEGAAVMLYTVSSLYKERYQLMLALGLASLVFCLFALLPRLTQLSRVITCGLQRQLPPRG